MEKNTTEALDSQIIAEHVSFLDDCFDNSFTIRSSLIAVKEYITEETNEIAFVKNRESQTRKHLNLSLKNTSLLETSKCVIATQTATSKKLKDWGLPLEIATKYEHRGITEMFDWQVECLGNPKVLFDCCNLVYSAPTSAGKTLVAEILTIKTVLERQKKVIVILPFVSIVREKMFYLQDILSSSGIRVEGFMGSQSPPGGLQAVHVAVCTIEKANSLVNRLLDEGSISELGAIIVDELHLLGDPHRGYILELLLTKIKYVSSKFDDVQIQIVGMSATLPNLEVLAKWLDAELFITQFRPIPLDEYCLVGNKCYDKTGKLVNTLHGSTGDSDAVLKTCLETIKDGCSILIFCMTKNRCENLAQSLASSFYKLGCEGGEFGIVLRNQLKTEGILEVLEQLRNCPVGLDQVLQKTIAFGAAYHHAGLTFDERDIIEGGFKSGAIRVLVATSTLSSGVNLPARRVIIRTPVFQRHPINILTYKQMIGRAGRMGKDTKGDSILVCTEAEKRIGFELMMGALDPVKSCIETEDKYMRAVLEMISSQMLCTKAELNLYSKCSLLYTQGNGMEAQNDLLENTLDELKKYELIRTQSEGDEVHYVATPLGKACLSSSMAPNDGLSLFCELQKARQCVVLETDLHLIYLVTPYSVSSQWGDIDWLHLLTLWETLTKAMKRVGELVGVQESFIIRCLRGANKHSSVQNKLNIHKRFYTALALQDLVNEEPLSEVATKFQCARGFLQSLQQSAATFAGMVTAFCRQLGWKNMEMLVSQFQDRLHFGIHSDLLELMRLPSLNGSRARTLFNSGYESIASIASADVNLIENALYKSIPFESDKEREGDDKTDVRKRNKIKSIWITGCCGMTIKEAAENLITEARKYLEQEIGVTEIKWNNKIVNNNNNTESSTNHDIATIENNQNASDTVDEREDLKQGIIVENPGSKSESITEKSNILTQSSSPVICSMINRQINEVKYSPSLVTKMNGHSSSIKDDIVWDSLNVTEAALDNISKFRTSEKLFSPNISFGDIDEKTTDGHNTSNNVASSSKSTMSVKDVSLFSSDGDNSSLFEESLPVDLIPSKFLDNRDRSLTLVKQEPRSEYASINSNSILNAFKSTIIDIDEDEDIKLIYDDDNKNTDDEPDIFNISDVEVNRVKKLYVENENHLKTTFKRLGDAHEGNTRAKKIKTEFETQHTTRSCCELNFQLWKTSGTSIKKTMKLNKFCFDCYIVNGREIIHFFNAIESENVEEASLYLNVNKTSLVQNEIIGTKVIKASNREQKDIINKDLLSPVKGVALYLDKTCVFLDFDKLGSYLESVKSEFINWFQKLKIVKMVSVKSNYLDLKRWLEIDLSMSCVDICIGEWLIDIDEKVPGIQYLVKKYLGLDLFATSISINGQDKRLKNLDKREECCLKAWSVCMISEMQKAYLLKQDYAIQNTIDIEIQISKILANCEYYGITVDKVLASRFLIDVKNSQDELQKTAHKLAGHPFNFNSSKDVAKVLGMYNGRKVSTKKSVLSTHSSEMSSIVINWRKLNSILTKTLYPLTEKACIYTEGDRINPTYTTHTCTGRISMHEPNLQNVPRKFSIPAETPGEVLEFNCRSIFKAAPGHVMVSADYCQLEMRILTHFSGDAVLTRIMNSDVDVFKSIAASWSNLTEDEVDDDLRQKAKQLCYGILYGMGNKTLSQHLDVSEMEAAVFMDTFYKTFPDVRTYTRRVVDECKAQGFVETLTKRRRYLSDISSNVTAKRSAAERQAVNTTIQGSAADIAKAAMCAIDTKTDYLHPKPRLILQMHDELIYEVQEIYKKSFIIILKRVMEDTVKLNVPLPVKVKAGYNWGALEPVLL